MQSISLDQNNMFNKKRFFVGRWKKKKQEEKLRAKAASADRKRRLMEGKVEEADVNLFNNAGWTMDLSFSVMESPRAVSFFKSKETMPSQYHVLWHSRAPCAAE
mgnify:CR=1 FL=1